VNEFLSTSYLSKSINHSSELEGKLESCESNRPAKDIDDKPILKLSFTYHFINVEQSQSFRIMRTPISKPSNH
jgi:hypothetical protein